MADLAAVIGAAPVPQTEAIDVALGPAAAGLAAEVAPRLPVPAVPECGAAEPVRADGIAVVLAAALFLCWTRIDKTRRIKWGG